MLTSQQEQLWTEYLATEARGKREAKLRALDAFVTSLTQAPISQWESWARDIARRVVDRGEDIAIRMPLFRDAVFPALLNGHRQRAPGCTRWLAGLSQQLYRCPDCENLLPDDERTEIGLLRAAVRLDPTDHQSTGRLIESLAAQLKSSLHELPSGVLYGMDGATPDQCLRLQAELHEFVGLVECTDQADRYLPLIDDCRFHFHHYRAYRLRSAEFDSYADYLGDGPETPRD